MSGRKSTPSSTGLAPECDLDPITSFAQSSRTTDQAVPVTEEVSGYSAFANTPGSEMKVVQALKRRKLSTSPLSTPDNPSIMDVSSLPPVSSRRNAAAFSSTSLDGHGKNSTGFLENSPYLSPADGIPKVSSTETVHRAFVGSLSSRIIDDSHGACIRENPVLRTPAGFNTAAHPDSSNITSPADTLSGQSRHASSAPHVPSISSIPLVPEESKARKTLNSDRKSRKVPRNGSSSKQVKDKPKLITPLEYAQKLRLCPDLRVKTNSLKGKRIFYVGGDMTYASTTTKGRMEYVSYR